MTTLNSIGGKAIHPCVLLTGAGFTHNFGGYLATQFWEHIFNLSISYRNPDLQLILKHNKYKYDFEEVYAALREKKDARFALYMSALDEVYGEIDGLVQEALNQSQTNISLHELRKWLGRFSGGSKKAGFIFTLNQDLFFERHGRLSSDFIPTFPGAPRGSDCSSVQRSPGICKVALENTETLDKTIKQLGPVNVIKLHGSCNWMSTIDGSGAMAIGVNKNTSIMNEPILSRYQELFEKVLLSGSVRQLWIVGYGYGDPHINRIIAKAIETKELSIMSIHPFRPEAFFQMLSTRKCGDVISRAVRGHYPNTLHGAFPWSGNAILTRKINKQMDLALED